MSLGLNLFDGFTDKGKWVVIGRCRIPMEVLNWTKRCFNWLNDNFLGTSENVIKNLNELDVLFPFSATNLESREYGTKLFLKPKSFFTHRISIKTTLTNIIRISFFEREFLYLLNWLFIYFHYFFNSQYLKTGGLFFGFLFFNRDLLTGT